MALQTLSLIMPACLEDVKINDVPHSAFYISDFITEEEEQILLNKVGGILRTIRFCC